MSKLEFYKSYILNEIKRKSKIFRTVSQNDMIKDLEIPLFKDALRELHNLFSALENVYTIEDFNNNNGEKNERSK